MKTFHLKFNLEADGCWYIEFPGYPLSHHNLMMVAGADLLCEYVAKEEGHPEYAVVDVTLDKNRIDGKDPDIIMSRTDKGYGATYANKLSGNSTPALLRDDDIIEIPQAWLCPVTLLVLFRYPKNINVYIKEKAMTLEEYKKKVRALYKKDNPHLTKREIDHAMKAPEGLWRVRMSDFTAEEMATMVDSGLV